MAVRSGFWNSSGSDIRRYYNSDFSHLISLLINDGVSQNYGDSLIPTTGNGMTVVIQTGEAWFNDIWLRNDTDLVIDIDAAPIVNNYSRLDAIAIKIDASSGVRDATIVYMAGTPTAGTPTLPAMVDTADVHWHMLASVLVKTNDTSIPRERITNYVGSTTTPLITGLIETISTEDLIQQWQAEFNSWNSNKQAEFEAWVETIQGILDEEAAGHLQLEIEDLYSKTHTNLLNPTLNTITSHGITCTANNDGSYTLDGTATSQPELYLCSVSGLSGKHRLIGCPSDGGQYTFCLSYRVDNVWSLRYEIGNGLEIDCDPTKTYQIAIVVRANQTLNNVVFKPMLTSDLSATYDDFVQYSGPGEINENVAELRKDVNETSNDMATKLMLAPIENTDIASRAYSAGEILVYDGQLRYVEAGISAGDRIINGVNVRGTQMNTVIQGVRADIRNGINYFSELIESLNTLTAGLDITGIRNIAQLNKRFMAFSCSSDVSITSSVTMPTYTKGIFVTYGDNTTTDGFLLAVDYNANLYVGFRNNSNWNHARKL